MKTPSAALIGLAASLESLGMIQLPSKGNRAVANAVSDVRPDSTRLVVGMSRVWRSSGWFGTPESK